MITVQISSQISLTKNSYEKALTIIILTARKEMMIKKIPMDIVNSITVELESEKRQLLNSLT